MIRNNKTPGLHVVQNQHCNAPRRIFANQPRNTYHGLGSNDRYQGRNSYNENGIKNTNNRSLRSLTSHNQRIQGKRLHKVDSHKQIRNTYNPESTEVDPYLAAEYGLNRQVKQAFSRNQTSSNKINKTMTSLQSYLIKKAPKTVSQIRRDIPINEAMRKHVIIWLIQLFHGARLKPETLFHCIFLFDYMLSGNSPTLFDFIISIQNLQLLALTCFLISCKYEEIYPPTIKKCTQIADFSYSKNKIIEMQAKILLQNQFCLTYPTRYTFTQHMLPPTQFAFLGHNKFKRLQHLTEYLLQISLLCLWDDATEDQIGTAAVFLAQKVLQIEVETANRKICQIAWKLMQVWKQNKDGAISLIFDSDRYSFVGGIHLDGI